MALTGELSDLSLAELIEFFCNQRKTGRLKVVYTSGPGYFYLQAGSVVHARLGALRGIEAVYYALTLPNASFTFSPAFEAPEHTINQPWTSVVLEGLRRMDEGIAPRTPFPEQEQLHEDESKVAMEAVSAGRVEDRIAEDEPDAKYAATDFPSDPTVEVRTFVPTVAAARRGNRPWTLSAVVGAVALCVAVIGVPWGWYAHNKAARLANEAKSLAADNTPTLAPPVGSNEPSNGTANEVSNEAANTSPVPSESEQSTINSESDLAAKRQREARAKELAKTREAATAAATLTTPKDNPVAVNSTAPKTQSSTNAAPKRVTVQVTYDENGRVTQASGGDATALRIARQKRFPAGKAGSTTITIPIN